ncbi:MAG: hypothetical protein HY897_21165 [Deltaproteobacteria bacterium]|nr:hypothetical protein [Deltaproteobacteria bacterium]
MPPSLSRLYLGLLARATTEEVTSLCDGHPLDKKALEDLRHFLMDKNEGCLEEEQLTAVSYGKQTVGVKAICFRTDGGCKHKLPLHLNREFEHAKEYYLRNLTGHWKSASGMEPADGGESESLNRGGIQRADAGIVESREGQAFCEALRSFLKRYEFPKTDEVAGSPTSGGKDAAVRVPIRTLNGLVEAFGRDMAGVAKKAILGNPLFGGIAHLLDEFDTRASKEMDLAGCCGGVRVGLPGPLGFITVPLKKLFDDFLPLLKRLYTDLFRQLPRGVPAEVVELLIQERGSKLHYSALAAAQNYFTTADGCDNPVIDAKFEFVTPEVIRIDDAVGAEEKRVHEVLAFPTPPLGPQPFSTGQLISETPWEKQTLVRHFGVLLGRENAECSADLTGVVLAQLFKSHDGRPFTADTEETMRLLLQQSLSTALERHTRSDPKLMLDLDIRAKGTPATDSQESWEKWKAGTWVELYDGWSRSRGMLRKPEDTATPWIANMGRIAMPFVEASELYYGSGQEKPVCNKETGGTPCIIDGFQIRKNYARNWWEWPQAFVLNSSTDFYYETSVTPPKPSLCMNDVEKFYWAMDHTYALQTFLPLPLIEPSDPDVPIPQIDLTALHTTILTLLLETQRSIVELIGKDTPNLYSPFGNPGGLKRKSNRSYFTIDLDGDGTAAADERLVLVVPEPPPEAPYGPNGLKFFHDKNGDGVRGRDEREYSWAQLHELFKKSELADVWSQFIVVVEKVLNERGLKFDCKASPSDCPCPVNAKCQGATLTGTYSYPRSEYKYVVRPPNAQLFLDLEKWRQETLDVVSNLPISRALRNQLGDAVVDKFWKWPDSSPCQQFCRLSYPMHPASKALDADRRSQCLATLLDGGATGEEKKGEKEEAKRTARIQCVEALFKPAALERIGANKDKDRSRPKWDRTLSARFDTCLTDALSKAASSNNSEVGTGLIPDVARSVSTAEACWNRLLDEAIPDYREEYIRWLLDHPPATERYEQELSRWFDTLIDMEKKPAGAWCDGKDTKTALVGGGCMPVSKNLRDTLLSSGTEAQSTNRTRAQLYVAPRLVEVYKSLFDDARTRSLFEGIGNLVHPELLRFLKTDVANIARDVSISLGRSGEATETGSSLAPAAETLKFVTCLEKFAELRLLGNGRPPLPSERKFDGTKKGEFSETERAKLSECFDSLATTIEKRQASDTAATGALQRQARQVACDTLKRASQRFGRLKQYEAELDEKKKKVEREAESACQKNKNSKKCKDDYVVKALRDYERMQAKSAWQKLAESAGPVFRQGMEDWWIDDVLSRVHPHPLVKSAMRFQQYLKAIVFKESYDNVRKAVGSQRVDCGGCKRFVELMEEQAGIAIARVHFSRDTASVRCVEVNESLGITGFARCLETETSGAAGANAGKNARLALEKPSTEEATAELELDGGRMNAARVKNQEPTAAYAALRNVAEYLRVNAFGTIVLVVNVQPDEFAREDRTKTVTYANHVRNSIERAQLIARLLQKHAALPGTRIQIKLVGMEESTHFSPEVTDRKKGGNDLDGGATDASNTDRGSMEFHPLDMLQIKVSLDEL